VDGGGGTVVGAGGTAAAGIAVGIGVGGAEGRGSATATRTRIGIARTTMATIRHITAPTTPLGLRIIHLSPTLSDFARKKGSQAS